jgi:hypothetical protein
MGEGRGWWCAQCREPLLCGAGLYWKNCSLAENSMSAACPDLRLRNTTAGAVVEYAAMMIVLCGRVRSERGVRRGFRAAADRQRGGDTLGGHAHGPGQAAGGGTLARWVSGRHVCWGHMSAVRDANKKRFSTRTDVVRGAGAASSSSSRRWRRRPLRQVGSRSSPLFPAP